MLFHTSDSVRAEIAYRQERLKREYQRPALFRRRSPKPEPAAPALCLAPSGHAS